MVAGVSCLGTIRAAPAPGRLRTLLTALAVASLWSVAGGWVETSRAAAPPARASPDLRFTRLSVEDGLSHSHVWSILQDRQGFLWFGTDMGGLNRYDGTEFRVYRHDALDPGSLVHNFVWVLYEDRAGTLWVGTNGGGLDRYDRDSDSFVHHRHDPKDPRSLAHDSVKAIYEDSSGILWVGTDGGLSRFDRDTGSFSTYKHDPRDPNGPSGDRVFSILEDAETRLLWLGVFGGGVDVLDRAAGRFTHYAHRPEDPTSLSSNMVLHLSRDRTGRVWVSTKAGLNRLDPGKSAFVRYLHDPADPHSLGDNDVRMTYEDRRGRFWAPTLGGLDLLDRETGRFMHYRRDSTDSESISDDKLRTIYEDGTGAIWIGTTNGGVSRLAGEPDKFLTYRHNSGNPNSLSHNSVLAIHSDAGGRLWIGTAGGLNRLDGRTFTRFLHDPRDSRSLSHNDARAIVEDARGVLWIGTDGGGLNRFDGKVFTHYRSDPRNPDSLAGDSIDALFPSPQGGLWIAVHNVGLAYFDGQRFTHYRPDRQDPGSLPTQYVLSIFEDREGAVWLGTNNMGLVQLDSTRGRFTPYPLDPAHPDSEAANRVHMVHADGAGSLWLGADPGLFRFDLASRRFTRRYTKQDGLPADTVVSVQGDEQGALWLGTPAGLSRFDPQGERFRNYDQSHGLQSNQFTWRACARAGDGRLFFGGVNGFNAFHPARLPDNPHVPTVVLTGFELFNQPVEVHGKGSPLRKAIHVAEEVTLRHDQSVFSIRFAALDYTSPKNNRYAYRMDGFDWDWNYTTADRRFATYTNLDPGAYVFRVKGSNSDGLWNESGVSLRIKITPPWWRTAWFRVPAGVALLGAILAVHRFRVRTLEERERRFRTLAESAPDIVARFDPDLRCRYVNPAVEEYAGKPAIFFVGKTLAELGVPPESPPLRTLRRVFETGEPAIEEFTFPSPRGLRSFESRLVPEQATHGHVTSVLGITRDITERKGAEERVRFSLQEKVVLLQEIHHRVKNNLQIVSSLLSLQSQHVGDPSAREALLESQDRVRAMAMIHEKLYGSKDLSRIDAREYLEGLLAALFRSHNVNGERVRLVVDVEGVALGADIAVPCGLLINELVVNALKHAFPDERSGTIRVYLQSQPASGLLLRVSDDGLGLPPDFDFRQTASLGLQLVLTLTSQLNGTIQLVPDEGTTFEVRFSPGKHRPRVPQP